MSAAAPLIPKDLVEWLEQEYFSKPLLSSDKYDVDRALGLGYQVLLVQRLRDMYEEQRLENETDRMIANGIHSPDYTTEVR